MDLALYQKLFEVTNATQAILKSIMEGKPIVEEAVVSIQALSLEGFITRGQIIATPKLLVSIKGPTKAATELAMLNTRAEANVITYELAKKLSCLILSIENLKLKTVSSQVLQFIGIVKAEVEIKHRIRYTTVFFLVRESRGQTLLIVLLGQLFTQAMKMTFEYRDYSSIDTISIISSFFARIIFRPKNSQKSLLSSDLLDHQNQVNSLSLQATYSY